MTRSLSEEDIEILRAEFDQYDTNKEGTISIEEFSKVLRASGQSTSDVEIARIIKEVDLSNDGTINFNEFIAKMRGQAKPALSVQEPPVSSLEVDTEADYRTVWHEYYPSLNGSITTSQFRQAMGELGENVTDSEVEALLHSVDGNQKISYREFVDFAKRKSGDV